MTKQNLLLLLACVSLLSLPIAAQAQQNSVAIAPASIDAKVKRGASYTQNFTLNNNTANRLSFKVSVEDVWYDEANKRTSGRAGTLPRSASLWVQFFPSEIVVEPRSSSVVKAIITVPQTAAGGYYAVPVFEAMPAEPAIVNAALPQGSSTATATIGVRFRGLMMLTTLDAAEYHVEIIGGQISPPSASTELAIQLDVLNRSTAHVSVRGAFAILNSSGALAGRGSIQEKRYLPDQQKLLQTGWAGELSPGKYTSVITLSYDRVGIAPATLVYELPFVVQ